LRAGEGETKQTVPVAREKKRGVLKREKHSRRGTVVGSGYGKKNPGGAIEMRGERDRYGKTKKKNRKEKGTTTIWP